MISSKTLIKYSDWYHMNSSSKAVSRKFSSKTNPTLITKLIIVSIIPKNNQKHFLFLKKHFLKMGLCNEKRKYGCYVFNGVVIASIAIAMVIVGLKNKNECETIPWWHIVGGALILLGLLGRIFISKVKFHIVI